MTMKIYYCILLCYFLKKNEPRLLVRIVISNTSIMTSITSFIVLSPPPLILKSISMVIDVSIYVRIDMQAAESDSNT